MFKLYLESTLLKYLFIIYLIFFFSFFIRAESNQNIGKLNLPDGFEISIFAEELESPRQITETDEGYVIVGSKKGDKIFALFDGDHDGYAETKIAIAVGLKNPTGVTYHKGDLYFAEVEDIWIIKNIDDWILSGKTELPPVESYLSGLPSETWHGFRHLRFGPDENLYIPIGVPCNVCIEPQTSDKRFAAIHKYENGELVMIADGVRNSVGIDWHPITKKLYFSDNGRDWLGDDSPSCELNIVDEEGSFFGFPYKHAKDIIDPEYGELIPSFGRKFIDPIAELGPHVAPLGIEFYDGHNFPNEYHNNLFIALHGSWNKYNGKSGYKVIMINLDKNGNYISQEDFITGWLENENAWGRPVQPFVLSDGSMLISDDKYNMIYRVVYKG
tara:strand:+ start:985 stop:2142 length:1158 start_codon:yes stop_codon:yes gene_type:complete